MEINPEQFVIFSEQTVSLKEKVSSFGLDFDKRDERNRISIFEN